MKNLDHTLSVTSPDPRLTQLLESNGFNVALGPDGFGFAYTGYNLNRRSISARWAADRVLALGLPPDIQRELPADKAAGRLAFELAPEGAVLVRDANGEAGELIMRVAALIKSLPSNPLAEFERQVAALPATTEMERLARQRVGQPIFREALDTYWNGRCAVTGITDRALLRASHIKAWADCASDAERLDVFNGLLLAAHIDAAFDAHLISFDPSGVMLFSPQLSTQAKQLLHPAKAFHLSLSAQHLPYLEYHRSRAQIQGQKSDAS
jgi:putative restriction endonuclease